MTTAGAAPLGQTLPGLAPADGLPPTPSQTLQTLQTLQAWRQRGGLRALDHALAVFLHELDADTPASLLLAAALLAQLEGRGHSCLPLQDLQRDLPAALGWPGQAASDAEAEAALAQALAGLPGDADAARAAWGAASVLQCDPADDAGSTPLVLQGDRLYLRRYWRYEREVAAQVQARTRPDEDGEPAAARPDPARVRALLAQLFAPPAAGGGSGAGGPRDVVAAVAAEAPPEPDWQQVACALALRGRLSLVTGGPGTGKTYTAARLLVLLQALHTGAQPLRVALAAPTGKAAARLRQSIDTALQALQAQLGDALPLAAWSAALGPARTLHALLGARPGTRRFVHDAANPLDVDLLFVDEASMVHLEMMATLLAALPPQARVVLLGDRDQLASVEAGAVLGDLCAGAAATGPSHCDAATVQWVQAMCGVALQPRGPEAGPARLQQVTVLRASRRFGGPIGQLALHVNAGEGAQALALLRADPAGPVAVREAVHERGGRGERADQGPPPAVAALALAGRPGAPGGYSDYLAALAQRPEDGAAFAAWAQTLLQRYDRFRVLCALREGPWGVAGLNAAIERALADAGLLPRRGDWYEGRPVMVTRNDAALGVFNGDIGLVLRPPGGGPLRAYFADGAALRSVAVGRLADVETAYAMTVHKSQGSEFAHVVLVLPDDDGAGLTRELVYTGITRAKTAFTLVARDAACLGAASARQTRRLSGLGPMLA